ncbi:baseplate J/gp47 family protein [uncultured Shewanella sp.]|uniref:baseplate J/gp47 family protein n=1 Tax=uncultured Shewanella sp. TaxID=173975 RepID=UPI0026117928|nr:baseplate J/gp47 family protein [uncultured Shewanella sp.]
MFPHQNPLPKPELLTTPGFEDLFAQIKQDVLAHIRATSPQDEAAVTQTLDNEAEILTKFTQAFTIVLQNHTRQINQQALQMFGMYATEDDAVDVIASQLGVKRLVLDIGDASGENPLMESNESLLNRYYLAAYALASTGTRAGYRFHAMTLGARPNIDISSPAQDHVRVDYRFDAPALAGVTKDAQARQVSPGVVDCYILTHLEQGIPSDALIAMTQAYLESDDIAQETDLITVKAPSIKPWQCELDVYIHSGPDADVIKLAAEKALQDYGKRQHQLGANIEPSMLYKEVLAATGAYRADIITPTEPLRCSFSEAAYLTAVKIKVIAESGED